MYDYEISIEFSNEGLIEKNVTQFISMRFPLLKQSSFALLTVNLSAVTVSLLQGEVWSGTTPMINVICKQLVDNKQSSTEVKKIVQNLIFKKPYNIAYINPRDGSAEPVDPDSLVITDMILISPTLHSLSSNNLFNHSFTGLTAKEIVEQYESFINDQLKLDFKFIYNYGNDDDISKFVYNDEILIMSENDLDVLRNILQRYKVTKHSTISFFDDFRYCQDNDKDICVIIFNLGAHDTFPKVNLSSDFPMVYTSSKFIKTDILNDYKARFFGPNPTIVSSIGTDSVKTKPSSGRGLKIPAPQTSTEQIVLDKGVNFTSKKVSISHKNVPESLAKNQTITIDSPDNIDLSIERYEKMLKLYLYNAAYVGTYIMQNIPIDVIQFGKKYNMYEPMRESYRFTPISICNEFVKKSERSDSIGSILQHNVTCQMLHYNYI